MKLPGIKTYLPTACRVRATRPGLMNMSGRTFNLLTTDSYSHRLDISLEPAATTPISFDVVIRRSGLDNPGRVALFKPSQIVFGDECFVGKPGSPLKAWGRMPTDLFGFSAMGISESFSLIKLPPLSDKTSFMSLSQRVSIGTLTTEPGIWGIILEFLGS